MADKLMYIPNDDRQNYLMCRLKVVVETFEHSTKLANKSKFTKVPKVLKLTNKNVVIKFGAYFSHSFSSFNFPHKYF